MADKDDFTFDEEESNLGSEQESDDWGDYEPEKKSGSKRLLVMLLLLLVLAGAAVYLFVLAPDDGPSSPVQVVNVPNKPVATPMPKPVPMPVPAPMPKPAPVDPQSKTPVPTVESAKPTPEPAQPGKVSETPAVPVVASPTSATPEPTKPVVVAKPEPAPMSTPPKPKLFEAQTQAKPVATGPYTLSAGAFAMKSSVNAVVKKIRKLGYEPDIQPITRKVDMTRLLVGVYSPDVAEKKLVEVKKVSPGAFKLNKGKKTAVYAGSFLVLDKARVFADTILTKNNIHVTEEPVKIDRTLQRVTFGGFASRDEAVKTAGDLSRKGLDAKPVKN